MAAKKPKVSVESDGRVRIDASDKRLKFMVQSDGYCTIENTRGDLLGDLLPCGEVFKRRAVLVTDSDVEWTSECLRDVADFLDAMERRRAMAKALGASRTVPGRKPKLPL